MRILVYPHDLGVGGSQLNAIEIGAAVRDLGHEVVVFAEPGPLQTRVLDLGLDYIAAPLARVRPSPTTIWSLRRTIAERRIDVVHAYEWPPAINSWIAVSGSRAKALATVMSMSVAPFLPRTMPLVVGTREIAAREQRSGRRDISVLEPPVDVAHDDARTFSDVAGLRRSFGLSPASIAVVAVSRLAHELKLEGLLTAIEVVPRMGADIQLLIVGDGPARLPVERAAGATNDALRREAVILAGEMADPRPAYAVADVTLAMGGSALRAMSFAKPVVVQGELGFWRALDETSVEHFLWHGWYGLGAGPETGAAALTTELHPLLSDVQRRRRLGALGRQLAEMRFSLDRAAQRQLFRYQAVCSAPTHSPAVSVHEVGRAFAAYVGHAGARKWGRLRGTTGRDDFNAAKPRLRARKPSAPLLSNAGSTHEES